MGSMRGPRRRKAFVLLVSQTTTNDGGSDGDSDGSDGGDGLSSVVVVTGELKKSEKISAGAAKGRMDHIVEMTNGAVVVS
jgi:hypothetical protein